MRTAVKYGLLACLGLGIWVNAGANSVTDVGVGPTPDYPPNQGTSWTLTSTCVDINENGEAACQTLAQGPVYGCGWRGAQNCSSKVRQVHRWDGFGLVMMSEPGATNDVPLTMNNGGDIAGYSYDGAVYPNGGGNGRIWQVSESPIAKPSVVMSLNDAGQHVIQNVEVAGGLAKYSGKAYDVDGVEIAFPGSPLRPFVIANNGQVIGGQVIQNFVHDIHSPTGDEIPEVSGVGWLFNQFDVDTLPLNEDGLYDIDGDILWPLPFYRPTHFTNYETTVSDANDYGDFVGGTRFGGLYSSRYCTEEGASVITDVYGGRHTVPWVCKSTNYVGGTHAGGKGISGINNIGDAVGGFTPGAYAYQSSYTTHPWVWLRNAKDTWDEYDANDLLPPDSGYTVVSVRDINDQRQIVGTCRNEYDEMRGCIIDITDPPIPVDKKKPFLRIDTPTAGNVSGVVKVTASAWDRRSRIKKVVFRVGKTKIGKRARPPYSVKWKTSGYAPGEYKIRVTAIDNAGNRKTRAVTVMLVDTMPLSPPGPQPDPTPTGDPVEGEGTITGFGGDYVEVNGVRLYFNATTNIIYNDVIGFAVGLSIQYKGVADSEGLITATDLEIN